jgi:hypothetical protein
MEKMAFSKIVPRPALLDQANPVMKTSLHGWPQQIYCDNLNAGIPGSHSTNSCTRAVVTSVLPRILLISLKLYVPLYLAWSAFRLRFPNLATLENVARSSVFLTGYTLTQYLGVMWFTSTIKPTLSRAEHASFAWLSGLWTLVERKERRPELALYCTAQALNSLYLQAKKKGYITRTPRVVSYLLLIVASGLLCAFNDQHPKFVSQCFGFDKWINYKEEK